MSLLILFQGGPPVGDQTVTPTGLAVAVAFGSASVGAQSVSPSGTAVTVAFGSPTLTAVAVNNMLRVDGEQDAIALGTVGALSNFTVVFWARLVADRNDYSGLFSMEQRAINDHTEQWNELITDPDGTTLAVYDHVTGNCGTVGVMTVGVTYRIAWRVDSSGNWASFFGVENTDANSTKVTGTLTNIIAGNNYAGLMATNFASTEWANGRMGLFRKWDALLTDAEIEREFHSHTPVRTADLLVFGLPRDVTSGTVLTTPTGSDFIDGAGGGTPDYTIEAGPIVLQHASPTGVAVAVAFGTGEVQQAGQTVSPSGTAVAVALFGSSTVQPGAVTISPSGLAVGAALGSATLTPGAVTVSPSGLAVTVAFGSSTVQPGAVAVSPSGYAAPVVFGSPALSTVNTLSPTGLAVAVAFGTASRTSTNNLSPTGYAAPVAFGSSTVQRGAVTAAPTGLAVAVSFGTAEAQQAGVQNVVPAGLALAVVFGSAEVQRGAVSLSPTGLTVGAALGSVSISAQNSIDATGLAVSVAFGSCAVSGTDTSVTITPSGYAVAVAFGVPTLAPANTLAPTGLALWARWGDITVQPGSVSVAATGVVVSVSFGVPEVVAPANQTVIVVGLLAPVVFGEALAYNDQAIRKPSTQGVRVVQVKPWPPPRGAWWFNGDR